MPTIKRVLIVDDDEDFADSIADLLASDVLDVTVAYDGASAVARSSTERFDLTLMDVQMPGQNGIQSLEQLLSLRPEARVVMMTGYSVPTLLDQAVAQGACGVMHKPLDVDRLRMLIDDTFTARVALVADDDADFVDSMRALLEAAGYTVIGASSGREAVDRAQAHPPDVLLLDLRMPGMTGAEVYRELDRLGALPPTVVISAYLDDEQDALASLHALPRDRILSKPVSTQRLVSLLDRLFAQERPG